MAERGLTADGDAQLHTTPLRQLHMEGAAARDDRLWVQTDVDPCETRPHTAPFWSGWEGLRKVTVPTLSCFFLLTDEETKAW